MRKNITKLLINKIYFNDIQIFYTYRDRIHARNHTVFVLILCCMRIISLFIRRRNLGGGGYTNGGYGPGYGGGYGPGYGGGPGYGNLFI